MLANLPVENACEPQEGAYQPQNDKTKKYGISFAKGTQSAEETSSQNAGSYKEMLSQPAPGLSHRQRMLWLQKRREPGLWAQCDDCGRWRHLPNIIDSHELPKSWYCRMNPDQTAADCSVPEIPIRLRDEEDLIYSEYSAGSVVWARLSGWPWWPAMVDDCPDTEQFYWLDGFSDIPTSYNVVFFDSFEVTRAWIQSENLKPYNAAKEALKNGDRRYKTRLEVAMRQADDAIVLPLANRLAKYSFIKRYKGTIKIPKKIVQKDLKKYKNRFKHNLNIEFSEESDSDSNDSSHHNAQFSCKRLAMKKANVIFVGTPKRQQEIIEMNGDFVKKANDSSIEKRNNAHETFDHNKETEKYNMEGEVDSMNINKVSSKTYPVGVLRTQSSESSPVELQNMEIRIATPSSDDFDF